MCTSSEVLPTPEDALPELLIDEFTASALGLTDLIEKFIANGVEINKGNIEGWSMLQYASFIGHTDLVHLLLEKGADPNIVSKGACPSLMLASRCGNEPIIIALLNRGASLEQVDNTGLTALHHAVNSGQDGSATVLLRHSKRMSPSESNVLLHSAVSRANVAVLKALLEGGLVPSSATRLSMIEIAQTRGDSELLQQVVSCGNTSQPRNNEDPFNRYLLRGPMEMQKLLQNSRPPIRRQGLHTGPVLSPSSMNIALNAAASPTSNSPVINSPIFTTPSFTTVDETLKYLKLDKYLVHFEKEDIDMQTFLTLTDADLKAIPIDLLGPRKKVLNYIKVAGNSSVEQVNELQVALITEQQSVHALKEKIKLDRENDLKNQQIIQSLFMSYQNIRESKDKILTSLTNASFVVQHIQEELSACKDKIPRYANTFSNSDSSSIFASSWPSVFKENRQSREQNETESLNHSTESQAGEHIALSSVNSVLDSASPYKDEKSWSSSWDDCNSGSSTSTLNASCAVDKMRKHLESAAMYTSTLYQHLQDGKQAASNMSSFSGLG